MKFLKRFESFHDTGVDDGIGQVLPEYNPAKDQEIKNFIDETNINQLSEIIGKKITHHVSEEDEEKIKELAFKILKENPELIPSTPLMKQYKVPGGDGIVRTNKIGSSSQTNSFRVGQ